MPEPKFGSWVVEPMSEISRIIYIKSHIPLHVKSNAENVNWMLGASHCYFNGVSWVKKDSKFVLGLSNGHVTAPSFWLGLSVCLSYAFHLVQLLFDFGMSCQRLPVDSVMD